jgi:hypothetical protein
MRTAYFRNEIDISKKINDHKVMIIYCYLCSILLPWDSLRWLCKLQLISEFRSMIFGRNGSRWLLVAVTNKNRLNNNKWKALVEVGSH